MGIRAARAGGLVLAAAALAAPWGEALRGVERILRPLGWPGVVFLLPSLVFLLGTGLLAWVLAVILPRKRVVAGTLRGFLPVLGLGWGVWALSLLSRPDPFHATWGGWLFGAVLVAMVVAELRFGERVGAAWVVVPWVVAGALSLVVVLPVWIVSLQPKPVTPDTLADWTESALDPLVARLERHRAEHGCYPREFGAAVSCDDFPREPASARVVYAELGLDDFALGVLVEYSREDLNPCGGQERAGLFTTGSGAPLPRFLDFGFGEFGYFYGTGERGTCGQWTLYGGGGTGARTGTGWEDLYDALEDQDAAVRMAAVAALGRGDNPGAVAPLARVLLHDPEPAVRRRAAWALGRIRDPWALAALREAEPDPAVAWATAQIEATPRRFRHLGGGAGSTHSFEEPRLPSCWYSLGDTPPALSVAAAYDGRNGVRLAAGQGLYLSAPRRERFTYGAAVRTDSGSLDLGFVERLGEEQVFFNAFHVEKERIEFRGTKPVPLGTFPAGQWRLLSAKLDFAALTAVLSVDGTVVARDVPIRPHRFEVPEQGLVDLGRWGFAATGDAGVDAVSLQGSGRSLQ